MSKTKWNKLVTYRTISRGDRILVDDLDGRMHEATVSRFYDCFFRRGFKEIVFTDLVAGQRYIIVKPTTKLIKLVDDYTVTYPDDGRLDRCIVSSEKHGTVFTVDLDLTVTGGL